MAVVVVVAEKLGSLKSLEASAFVLLTVCRQAKWTFLVSVSFV